MVKVHISSVIEAPVARVWALVRDFNALPAWHPVIADSRIEDDRAGVEVGCVRAFHTKDGGFIRERLLSFSDHDYAFSYSILESPMGVDRYVAAVQLTPVTDGNRTFAQWRAEFDCAPGREGELANFIGQAVFQAGFDALKALVRG